MRIRCWGARGSIPVSGPNYLKYGGDTTCMEVRTADDTIIIVDAGSGIRRLANSLIKEGRFEYTMLFTHAHWDHILGFPYFKPIYEPGTHIEIHGCPMSQGNIRTLLAKTMSPPYYPVPFEKVQAEMSYCEACSVHETRRIAGMEVHSINLSHPNLGLGYKFMEQGRSFVFLTDNELGKIHPGGRPFEDYVAFCRDADLLVHDAEFTEKEYEHTRGWGHSTYRDALRLALEAGVKRFGLFHHNQDRHDQDLDLIIEECRNRAKAEGSDLDCFGITQDTELIL